MGLIEDISRFLETRLEEYIRSNPQMELQVLEDQLRGQAEEVAKLIVGFEVQEKGHQDQILAIAEEIKLWHGRALKAEAAGRPDLANGAKEREAALLRQGNQVWAQMELVKQRRAQTLELQSQIQARRKEVQAKIAEAAKAAKSAPKQPPSNPAFNWENLYTPQSSTDSFDDLDNKFKQWEMDEELERLKRKMGKS
ncbi:TIGR04376 family protein [Tumidithrix elongata RA019]|uniref:TIGR04376 family protein n=1 Tax=Tumidithrix elongata BACA0141 TaxID=2716417 RepID=A0AAW9Q1T7_9CYAN|nr:TIGR04376 family protein [Tumidithrix elongata RA019]